MMAMIRCLQMVLHVPFMKHVVVPGNISMVFGFIIPIVMFDVLENDDYTYTTFLEFDE
jgi:flagellar biosynthesis protein FliR